MPGFGVDRGLYLPCSAHKTKEDSFGSRERLEKSSGREVAAKQHSTLAGAGSKGRRSRMGLLKGLLGARKLLLKPSSCRSCCCPRPCSTPAAWRPSCPPRASGSAGRSEGRSLEGRGAQCKVQHALLSVSRSGNAFLEEA